MRSFVRASIASLLLFCLSSTDAERVCHLTDDEQASLRADLEQDYHVQLAKIYIPDLSNCMNWDQSAGGCNFNNPDSPYGLVIYPLPYGHNESLPSDPMLLKKFPTAEGRSLNDHTHVRQDETFVLYGCLPPRMQYYGWTNYVAWRYAEGIVGEGAYKPVLASLGDPLNHLAMKSAQAEPFDAKFAMQLTGDQGTYEKVVGILQGHFAPNASAAATNVFPIPHQFYPDRPDAGGFRFGIHPRTDMLTTLLRMAFPDNWTEWQHWRDEMPLVVYRLTPKTPIPESDLRPFPPPTLRNRVTESNELYLNDALNKLRTVVRDDIASQGKQSWTNWFSMRATSLNMADWGADCLTGPLAPRVCFGENTDAIYSVIFPAFRLSPTDSVYFVGVNHRATRHATYANLTPNIMKDKLGVISVDAQRYDGSAARYLNGTEYADVAPLLFVYRFAYDCGDDVYCTPLPVNGSFQAPPGTGLTVMERAYLNPTTKTGAYHPGLIDVTYLVASSSDTLPYSLTGHDLVWLIVGFTLEYKAVALPLYGLTLVLALRVLYVMTCVCCCSSRRRHAKPAMETKKNQ